MSVLNDMGVEQYDSSISSDWLDDDSHWVSMSKMPLLYLPWRIPNLALILSHFDECLSLKDPQVCWRQFLSYMLFCFDGRPGRSSIANEETSDVGRLLEAPNFTA